MPLRIEYSSSGFPAGSPVSNGFGVLSVTWDDLAWAAITIGRPDWVHVVAHGDSSLYEAIFRWSLLRMALEQAGPAAYRLRRTPAAKALDPTEKGAVNYFVGMVMCKLVAAKLLNAPWLLHLDVYGGAIAQVLTGRSRPDLIGQIAGTSDWIVLESKGRISRPSVTDRSKAKNQALRVTNIGGAIPRYAIGAITYLKNEVLQFEWEDPVPNDNDGVKGRFEVPALSGDAWRFHYQSAVAVYRAQEGLSGASSDSSLSGRMRLADVSILIHPELLKPLLSSEWSTAKAIADRLQEAFTQEGYQHDGLRVKAGQSWLQPFKESASA